MKKTTTYLIYFICLNLLNLTNLSAELHYLNHLNRFCLDNLITRNNYTQTKYSPKLKTKSKSTNAKLSFIDTNSIEFFGTGNIQNATNSSNNNALPATSGFGVYFTRKFDLNRKSDANRLELELVYNIASTIDSTIKPKESAEFGRSILLPTLSGQAFKFEATLHTNWQNNDTKNWYIPNGLMLHFSSASQYWRIAKTDTSLNISPLAIKIGPFYEFISDPDLDRYSIRVGLNLSYRGILGISTQKTQNIYNKITGSNNRNLIGFELYFRAKLNRIKFEVGIPLLFSKSSIEGLSGGQAIYNVGFMGGFSLPLTK